MKKVLLIALAIVGLAFSSCKKDPVEPVTPTQPVTYTITNGYGEGIELRDIWVFEYMGSEIIEQRTNIGTLTSGQTSMTVTANTKADKIKISVIAPAATSDGGYAYQRIYYVQSFMLPESGNLPITLNGQVYQYTAW